ncbi:hypothetical protein [Solibacillus sp.]|uniref:hypothetical protein n=1 Tax=Solibacillus sp. TaxID=1909654 RepID=UPI0033163890
MANLIGTPTYVNVLRQLETTDPAHPNTWNPNYQALINNDAYLKGFIEGLMKAATGHKHSGVDGDGAKIPISSITEDIVTKAELNAHIGSRGSAHAIVTTTEDGFMSKTDKSKLDGIAAGANNYTHPSTHPASIITEQTNKRFMTDAERTKLTGIAAGANNYVHPANHPASIITQDANNLFTTDAEKTAWNAKETTSGAQTKANTAESNAKKYTDQHSNDDIAHNRYGTATGTNALVVTLTPAPSKLVAGITLRFKNTTANTGAVTLNVNGLGAKPIVKNGGVALSAGNLKASGIYTVCYDGANFILQGEGGDINASLASYRETKKYNADSSNAFSSVGVDSGGNYYFCVGTAVYKYSADMVRISVVVFNVVNAKIIVHNDHIYLWAPNTIIKLNPNLTIIWEKSISSGSVQDACVGDSGTIYFGYNAADFTRLTGYTATGGLKPTHGYSYSMQNISGIAVNEESNYLFAVINNAVAIKVPMVSSWSDSTAIALANSEPTLSGVATDDGRYIVTKANATAIMMTSIFTTANHIDVRSRLEVLALPSHIKLTKLKGDVLTYCACFASNTARKIIAGTITINQYGNMERHTKVEVQNDGNTSPVTPMFAYNKDSNGFGLAFNNTAHMYKFEVSPLDL